MNTEQPVTHYLKDYTPPNFIVDEVFLHFDLHEGKTDVKSVLHMHRNPAAVDQAAPLILDGEELSLCSVILDGKTLAEKDYAITDSSLTIPNVPEQFILETEVLIKPEENLALSGLYKSRTNYCTQCESQGFRRITYFLDRPDVMSKFTTTITADKKQYPMLLSNGNLIEEKELSGGRHWVKWQDPSLKPCYLFALVAGEFDLIEDTYTTMSGRVVALKFYLERGFGDQGYYALESLKRAMKWDEDTYGREYDLDIYMVVAVSDFNMGAMENKGLNVFNTKYVLAKPESATDADYVAIEEVIGHEYFHNWSGNRVTCRDWFQLTLKEGLTVFRDQTFTEDMTSKGVARIGTANVVRSHQFLEDAGPMAHPIRPKSYIEINNFYTQTVYRKGSEVIRMVRTLITPDVFRKGMDLYFSRHDGQAVTTDDFIQAMADASGKDFTQFKRWYDQAGTPELWVTSEYDETAKTFTLHIKQTCPATPGQPEKESFHLPFSIGLIGPECTDMPLQLQGDSKVIEGTSVLEVTEQEQSFTFINVAEKPVPSLLRGFSAPVKLHYDYSNDELAWLLQCDSDPFSRWDASQMLCINIFKELMEQDVRGEALVLNSLLIASFQKILRTESGDLDFLSKLLALPSLDYMLSNIKGLTVDVAQKVRKFTKQTLAKALETDFEAAYERCHTNAPYQYTMQEMGKRSFKNACLSYLAELQNKDYLDLALQQFERADNMTDQIGALTTLSQHECAQRSKALLAFYEQWKDEPLVVNKWFSVQALSTLPDTLENVKGLMQHAAFNIRNPNNVYALIVAFGANTFNLHHHNGDGYAFLADQVIAIDSHNPQVAGRVIQPLTRWKQFDEQRGALMKKALERVSKQKKLSKDIKEIVTKSLLD